MSWQDFHFQQPLWFIALLPLIVIAAALWRHQGRQGNWQQIIDAELLPYLLSGQQQNRRRALLALFSGWLLAVIALAGPSWEKLPQPLLQKQDALVILLDLSYSMYAEDIQPSRLIRARQKILDMLQQRKEGLTALVSYAGDAHIVSPLTDDIATIANLVPALEPAMMPALGSNPAAAIKTAIDLLNNSGLKRGRILLIGDALTDSDINAIRSALDRQTIALSLLAVGTAQGAPIPYDNGFVRHRDGSIVLPGLKIATFEELAGKTAANLQTIQLDDSDIRALLPDESVNEEIVKTTERSADLWRNRGPWLAMLLLPLAALAFRRGWLIAVTAIALLQQPESAQALEWQNWWKTADQQAADTLARGDAAAAAEQFENLRWKGSAYYQASDYAKALESFSSAAIQDSEKTADDFYNLGNTLARNGKLDEAIAAYDQALAKNPDDEDAKFNKKLVEKLKQQAQNSEQQAQDNQQQGQDSQQQNQQQQNQEQQNQSQPSSQTGQNNPATDPATPQSSDQDPNFDEQAKQDQQNREQQLKEQQAKQQEPQQPQSSEAKQASPAEKPAEEDGKTAQAMSTEDLQKLQQQQATEQWLRQIPDDPGGLMQRKFRYEYEQRRRQGEAGTASEQPW